MQVRLHHCLSSHEPSARLHTLMALFEGSSSYRTVFWPPMNVRGLSSLDELRALMRKHNIGYYLVLTQDQHDSEYVAAADMRRAFISGFTGSAGVAIIGLDFAELSTDGRYYLQASKELGPEWTLRKEGSPGVEPWYKAVCARANESRLDIGVDPKFISLSLVEAIQTLLVDANIVPIQEDLVDQVWKHKPAEPNGAVFEHSIEYAGEARQSKIQRLRSELRKKNCSYIVLFALDEIAWLLNLRGSDIEYNPVFKSYAIVSQTTVELFVDEDKIKDVYLTGVKTSPYDSVFSRISAGVSEKTPIRVWIPSGSSWALSNACTHEIYTEISPVKLFKTVKNHAEIDGARSAQVKCGTTFVQLFNWLEHQLSTGKKVSEWDAAEKLLWFREKQPKFKGLSYETISSVGPNAAMNHYAPTKDTKFNLSRHDIYLLDAGCQFLDGTTDTTRTVHFGDPTSSEIEAFTLVLKGHIALASAVFRHGTTGNDLDVLARQYLWQQGLDYRHGTGHGVGSFLNVHEPPAGFGGSSSYGNIPLEIGNIISNEPGFYVDNQFGVRIESLLLVTEAKTHAHFGGQRFYCFETITTVPIALNLINISLLTAKERQWLNSYNKFAKQQLWPNLSEEEREWFDSNVYEI